LPDYFESGADKYERGDYAGAIADYSSAIAASVPNSAPLAPREEGQDHRLFRAHLVRGMARTCLRDWSGALADFRRACELAPADQDDTRLFIWMCRSRLGEREAADAELREFSKNIRPTGSLGEWFSRIARFLTGGWTEGQLLQGLEQEDDEVRENMACVVYFYTGLKRLLSGDEEGGRERLRRCVATGRGYYAEHGWARLELERPGR
jgi:tetratricopeptide (TPR) repeat protein